MIKKITILGGGSWGTAIATVLANNGHRVNLWCYEQSTVESIISNRCNTQYLDDIRLNKNINATDNLQEAIEGSNIIFEATPVLFLRNVLELSKYILHNFSLHYLALVQ